MVEKMNFEIYTDGGCKNSSVYGEGGAAYIILQDGVEVRRASKGFIHTSNNRMEMLAIISAINALPAQATATIYSDSQYAINVFSGTWKPKANLDLTNSYAERAKNLNINFVWVKGHDGNHYNELVDAMCTEAINGIVAKYNLPENRYTKRR